MQAQEGCLYLYPHILSYNVTNMILTLINNKIIVYLIHCVVIEELQLDEIYTIQSVKLEL